MAIGIPKAFDRVTDLPITSSVALVSGGIASPIAANQRQLLKYFLPISVGATGGVRIQIVVPAAGTAFIAGIKLVNTVAPSITPASQTASAAFTNALANAGTHWIEIDAVVTNGANAGNVDLQIAQNTSDVLTLTLLRGANVRVLSL